MRILGIDPGLKITGYGLIDINAGKLDLIEAGIIETKDKDPIEKRINRIYHNIEDILTQHKPDVMILEKLYTHYQYPVTACVLGHVRGVICLLCAQRNARLVEYSVKRIRKAVTGKGSATKMQTQGMVAHLLKIDSKGLTPDASDALALALGYARISGKEQ